MTMGKKRVLVVAVALMLAGGAAQAAFTSGMSAGLIATEA
jgi:hypothetical protein